MPPSTKPRLLLVTRNMPPLIGGMETLMLHTAIALSDTYQVHVIAPKGCREHLPQQISAQETRAPLPLFLIQSLLFTLWFTFRHKPVIVFGGSGLLAPCLTITKALLRVKTVCYVHGLDIIVDNTIYQRLFTPCLKYQDLIIANSKNTQQLAIEAKVHPEQLNIVHPGCNTGHQLNKKQARVNFDQHFTTAGKRILLFVGRITPRKGLKAFIEKSFENLLREKQNLVLCIVGDNATDGLTQYSKEKEQLLHLIEQKQWQQHIHFLGKVGDKQLQEAYAAADCLIFPLVHQPGDIEGFGMVAIEAAAQGTPSIAFNVGGISDAINHFQSGILVEAGNYDKFNHSICHFHELIHNTAANCYNHAQQFSWDHYQSKLLTTIATTQKPL